MPDQMLASLRCDVCGAPIGARFARVLDPQTREMFRIDQCEVCGLGHTIPQPADLDPYYGRQYHGGRHGVTDRLCMRRRLGFLNQVARRGRLLDYGCGDGGFMATAAGQGWTCTGVEMRPEHARARGLAVHETLEGIQGGFDAVTLWHVLEHVRSPQQTIESLLPLLRPGGTVLVAVPNWRSLQVALFGRHWFHNDVPRHLSHFTPEAMTALLSVPGLEVVRRWNLEAEIDFFGWPQSALNCFFREKNVLFDTVTRRGRRHPTWLVAASLALGSLFAVLSLPLFLASIVSGKGAIMVYAARRTD